MKRKDAKKKHETDDSKGRLLDRRRGVEGKDVKKKREESP